MRWRINRTIRNWRWWVALPVMAILTPLTIIEFALRGIAFTAAGVVVVWDTALDALVKVTRLDTFTQWVRKGGLHD